MFSLHASRDQLLVAGERRWKLPSLLFWNGRRPKGVHVGGGAGDNSCSTACARPSHGFAPARCFQNNSSAFHKTYDGSIDGRRLPTDPATAISRWGLAMQMI